MRGHFASIVSFGVVALLLAGCSGGGLLSGKESVPRAANVPVGNNLALPPDLQLQPPSGNVDAYQPNGAVAPINPPPSASTKLASIPASKSPSADGLYGTPGAPAADAPRQDIFGQYGISKTKPDGTAKTPIELNRELGAAIKKKRQEQNPRYGTIANIGAIFSGN
jgi:hypothetical protein